jgi:signal transduction histidine kinase
LADALNTMLGRLDTSIDATRRFTADVGHEVRGPLAAMAPYLEALLATSDPDQAHAAKAASTQHRRLTALIEGLQTLARGDAGALPATEEIEFGTLVGELVRQARTQHPDTAFILEDASAGAAVGGWRDGLRIAVWNLLDNAAVHGRSRGNVQVSVDADDCWLKVTVADDGPGIPADQRGAMLERFRRGPTPRVPGSGLGLSLVEQQARLHHGTITLGDSSLGGLAATLQLSRISSAEDS